MAAIYSIFEVLATFVESYFSYRFNDLLVAQKMQKKKCLFLSVLLTAILYIINNFSLFSIGTLIIALLFVPLTNRFLFKIPFFDTFSITAFYSFCLISIDFFSMTILGLLFNDSQFADQVVATRSGYRCVLLLTSKMALGIAYYVLRKLLIHLQKLKSRNLLLITVLGYIGVCYYAESTFKHIDLNIIISWFTLFTIVILSIFSFLAYINYRKEIEIKRIIEVKSQMTADGYLNLVKSYQGNAEIYHDMKHHIYVLQELFERKKYSEVGKYLNSLCEITATLEYTWTGSDIIDCILNHKKSICEQMNIDMIIDADPIGIELDGFTVSTIISNLLDNAIEACQRFKDEIPNIKVVIRHINDMVFIKIQNPVSDCPVLENGTLVTTKQNKDGLHGWGLKSIEVAVKRAGGVFRYFCENAEFIAIVTLFL